MKGSTKKWFITAGILITLGILTGLVVFAASGFKFSAFVINDDRIKKEYNIQLQDAVNLDINTISSRIILKESDTEVVKISCYISDRISYDTSVNEKTLKIEEKDNRKWYEFLLPFINIKDTPLIIELPKNNWEKISLNSTSGNINANNFVCRDFFADTTSGDINLSNIHSDEDIQLDTTSGDITIKKSDSSTIRSESTSGDIYISDITFAGDIEAYSTSGDISVYNLSDVLSLLADATSGDIEIHSLFTDKIELKTISGDIEFSDIDANAYKMTAISGDIAGTIKGDEKSVTFITDTTSGDISVPYPSMGDKIFNAKTTSGDIEIRFCK